MAGTVANDIATHNHFPLQGLTRRPKSRLFLLTLIGACSLLLWGRWIFQRHDPPPLVLLEDPGPRPAVALTSLGLEAEEAYHLGTLSLPEYRSSLESFINITFPMRLRSQLNNSLGLFLDFNSTNPHPERPRIIWQTNDVLPLDTPRTWQFLNKDHEYRFLNDKDADKWVHKTFEDSAISWAWDFLPRPVMKADFLRYLLLLVEGGTYSDIDTVCLKPISHWGSNPEMRGHIHEDPPSAIVGIEADVGDDRLDWHRWWSRPLQIVQWTMAFSPGHPVLLDAVRKIYAHSVERERMTHSQHFRRQSIINMTLEWTGPAVFTDAMLRYVRIESNLTWADLRGLKKPLRTGSVTFLPVTGFSPGVGNFGAKEQYDKQAMVFHQFKGTWKPRPGKEQ